MELRVDSMKGLSIQWYLARKASIQLEGVEKVVSKENDNEGQKLKRKRMRTATARYLS